MSEPLILVVDDDTDLARLVSMHLRRWGYRTAEVGSGAELVRFLDREEPPDLVLLDVLLGDDDGSVLVGELKDRYPDLPVAMVTRSQSLEIAVRSMKLGAFDYITKPIDFDRLQQAVKEALRLGEAHSRFASVATDRRTDDFHGILGASPAMQELYRRIEAVAPTDASVLVLGETGTGKEMVASVVHRISRRRKQPFVPVNTAAIPKELVESSLFGHEKGAFTGAYQSREGYCTEAHRGTLFLDEIGEMSFDVQAKLLRFLQDQVVQTVGGGRPRRVDVRVVAATNVDPQRQIEAGKLREDLFYRLRVVSLEIPPLRDRLDDIPLLARHFLASATRRYEKSFGGLDTSALEVLLRYDWPGNVRQLKNLIEEAVVLHDGERLEASMLTDELSRPGRTAAAEPTWSAEDLVEKASLEEALETAEHQPEVAAEALGISRATIYRRMKKYGLGSRR